MLRHSRKQLHTNFNRALALCAVNMMRGDDGGDGGDGGGGDATFTQADIDAAVQRGMSQAQDKFNRTKNDLLADIKKLKQTNAQYDGLDVDKIKTMQAAFENDQDMKDIAEGKFQEVLDRRLERDRANYKSQIDALTKQNEELSANYSGASAKITDLMINNTVTSEFVKQKGLETAIPDVVARAKSMFKVEGDEVIARNSNGDIITGEKGPLTITEWIANDLQKNAAHLFQGSQGAGGGGGGPQGNQSNQDQQLTNAAKTSQADYQKMRRAQLAKK